MSVSTSNEKGRLTTVFAVDVVLIAELEAAAWLWLRSTQPTFVKQMACMLHLHVLDCHPIPLLIARVKPDQLADTSITCKMQCKTCGQRHRKGRSSRQGKMKEHFRMYAASSSREC